MQGKSEETSYVIKRHIKNIHSPSCCRPVAWNWGSTNYVFDVKDV